MAAQEQRQSVRIHLIETLDFLTRHCPGCYIHLGALADLGRRISPRDPILTMNEIIEFDRGLNWPKNPYRRSVGCGAPRIVCTAFVDQRCRYQNILVGDIFCAFNDSLANRLEVVSSAHGR